MNDEAKNKAVVSNKEKTDKSQKQKSGRGLYWLLTILVVVSLALSVFNYVQLKQLSLNTRTGSSSLAEIEARLVERNDIENQQQADIERVRGAVDTLAEQIEQTTNQLGSLYKQQSMGNNEWALAEIEHLLIIASHRLQLERDIPMALAALDAADQRLRDNDDPGLLVVREQLKSDINSLAAVENVDTSGLALYLSDLVNRVSDLPLLEPQVEAEVSQLDEAEIGDGKWEQFKSAVWLELKGLVQISRQGEQTPATLLPEQRYFLYQNLRLQLETARFAVLRRDTESLQASLQLVDAWIQEYFDVGDSRVANMKDSLIDMRELNLRPALPQISSSLETLRAYSRTKSEDGDEINAVVEELEQ